MTFWRKEKKNSVSDFNILRELELLNYVNVKVKLPAIRAETHIHT